MKTKEIIFGILFCLFAFVFMHFMNNRNTINTIVYETNNQEENSESESSVKNEETPQELIERLQKENKNKDIKALFRIPNTTYSSIVPQGSNNKYYLRRLPDKTYSRLGSTYLDYRVDNFKDDENGFKYAHIG